MNEGCWRNGFEDVILDSIDDYEIKDLFTLSIQSERDNDFRMWNRDA